MKITPELIEKYALGTCSDTERKAVEHWIATEEDEETSLSEYTLQKMKTNIWNSLSTEFPEKETPVIPLVKKWPRYAASACIIIGLIGFGIVVNNKLIMNQEISIDNTNATNSKFIQTAGLDFTLMPNSKVNVSSNNYLAKGKVGFGGAMKIENKSGKDIEIEVSSLDGVGPTQKILCENNEVYYVFQHTYKFDEVYVMNASAMEELPAPVRHKVKKIFNIYV